MPAFDNNNNFDNLKPSYISRAILVFALLLIPSLAMADRRIFAKTYPYMTLPKGGFEIEHYLDADIRRVDDPDSRLIENGYRPSWTMQVEFEYGITDRLDFGFYTVFRQKAYQDFELRGVKLRSRYRLFDEGELPVDTALYLELVYYGDEVKIEEIIILARKFGSVETAVNFKFEEEFKLKGPETEFEFVFVPSVGVGYHFNHNLSLGLEWYGKLAVEHGEAEDFINYLGPAISVAGDHFFWTVLVAAQLNGVDDGVGIQARSLFGVQF